MTKKGKKIADSSGLAKKIDYNAKIIDIKKNVKY